MAPAAPAAPDRTARRRAEAGARDLRLHALREGATIAEIVDRLLTALPDSHPLEVHRWARGWGRGELSARIDLLYEGDGLIAPGISDAELCRWEHGKRRPSDERIDVLCRVYSTRPDRLGFGQDYSGAMLSHLEMAGITDVFPRTDFASKADLVSRLRNARKRITMFGLTRNFYGSDEMLPLFQAKAREVPIRVFIMDPHCASRVDRYRLEPIEAAMEDPARYEREVLRPLAEATREVDLRIYLYDFPCSFAMEQVDDVIRVMLYGHGKRGTDGPIMTFAEGTPHHTYFADQLAWMQRLTDADPVPEPWRSKGVNVWPYEG